MKPVENSTTLVINRSDSYCERCGKGAFPDEKTHKTLAGWGAPYSESGCGVRWKGVRSDYLGMNMKERCKEMRPDLEWVGYEEIIRKED